MLGLFYNVLLVLLPNQLVLEACDFLVLLITVSHLGRSSMGIADLGRVRCSQKIETKLLVLGVEKLIKMSLLFVLIDFLS